MTELVHEHGALAGAELWTGGSARQPFHQRSRTGCRQPAELVGMPYQARAMDKADIRDCRRGTARPRCGPKQPDLTSSTFTQPTTICCRTSSRPKPITRSDEYGGSLENRVRLVRELIEETKDAVGDTLRGGGALFGWTGRPDDGNRYREHGHARNAGRAAGPVGHQHQRLLPRNGRVPFVKEASLEAHMSYVKSITSKPVVSGGSLYLARHHGVAGQARHRRFHRRGAAIDRRSVSAEQDRRRVDWMTSANVSAATSATRETARQRRSAVRRTRPSAKSGGAAGIPKKSPPKASDSTVLVVGAGPAGLEATRALGKRGYQVLLAEAEQWTGRTGHRARPRCRASANGRGCATIECNKSRQWPMSRSISTTA